MILRHRSLSWLCLVWLLSWMALPLPARAAPRESARSVWTELGTMAGPVANPHRSQPAHLLRDGDHRVLIDVGDGVAEQLAKIAVPLDSIQTVIISHLHIDHTGGLFAVLGMRLMTRVHGVLTIYGPPGTRQMVQGLIAALQPLADLQAAADPHFAARPADQVKVVEISGDSRFQIGPISVTAVDNTHYGFAPGSAQAKRFQSLSYRFDMPDGSIVYTGDTGPSENVEKLARHADLLLSEIIDPAAAMAMVRKHLPNLPSSAISVIESHFRHQHLTPDAVGLLADRAGVKALVLTHNGLMSSDQRAISKTRSIIASHYKGPIVFARDLQSFYPTLGTRSTLPAAERGRALRHRGQGLTHAIAGDIFRDWRRASVEIPVKQARRRRPELQLADWLERSELSPYRFRRQTTGELMNRSQWLFTATVGAVLGYPSASAQTSPVSPPGQQADGTVLQEVVVTAQRRSENLQNVPIAVTALSGTVAAVWDR